MYLLKKGPYHFWTICPFNFLLFFFGRLFWDNLSVQFFTNFCSVNFFWKICPYIFFTNFCSVDFFWTICPYNFLLIFVGRLFFDNLSVQFFIKTKRLDNLLGQCFDNFRQFLPLIFYFNTLSIFENFLMVSLYCLKY